MTPINNNQMKINILEEIEGLLTFYNVGEESYNPKNRKHLTHELQSLVTAHEQQVVRDFVEYHDEHELRVNYGINDDVVEEYLKKLLEKND